MKFIAFIKDGVEQAGILSENNLITSFSELLGQDAPKSLVELIENWDRVDKRKLQELEGSIKLSEVKVCSPIQYPKRGVFCLGKNYLEHALELHLNGQKPLVPTIPIYFLKLAYPSIGQDDVIPYDENVTSQLDYEVELALIIGKKCKNIKAQEVADHIFGYTILNDVSARDVQNKHIQWFLGKSADGYCPIGPVIVHSSAIEYPPKLDICSRVNGELRQNSNTSNFIFSIEYCIEELSKSITLYPGDIIATGTPAGVGMGFTPPRLLKPGDVVECEIEGIGILRNTVK